MNKPAKTVEPYEGPPSAIDVACLVLVDFKGCLLATQRPYGKSLGGLWEFPGGKVEAGESAEEALRRELREELHLEVENLEALTPVIHTYDFATIRLIPFLARCTRRPELHLVEHADHCWVHGNGHDKINWAPADLPVIAEVETVLNGA